MKRKLMIIVSIILITSACAPAPDRNVPILTSTISSSLTTLPVIPTSTPEPSPASALPETNELSPAEIPTVVQSNVLPGQPITMPDGFGIGVFASGLNDPRMMAIGPDGLLYAAERGAGRIVRLPDTNQDGQADAIEVIAKDIRNPSSLAFSPDGSLYVAETTRVWRLTNPDAQGVFQERAVIIDDLPGGGHSTRTLLFSPDGSKLYVSIGSSCNVCIESDNRRSTIMQYNPDGSDGRIFAKGLRNAVGITFRTGTQEMWATNNGRDNMGDDTPPETVYQVEVGKDYGWPYCHAGTIIDPDFGSSNSCQNIGVPAVELQAHMAPLGLTFYDGTQFPPEYQGSLFIALHGSWNRSVPVGYKIMRVPIINGQAGQAEDFATGWLTANGNVWGRPVDVVVAQDGSMFVSDDGGGVIYRIFFTGF